jgi:tripartite-type tricarboxylate transporter receptor subunit TctC
MDTVKGQIMNGSIKRIIWSFASSLGFLLGILNANAQNFPSKPMRLVVPYAAGGVGDITARLVAQKMSEDLGQPILIDNKPGAGLTTGMEYVAKSAADGYTMVIAGNGQALAKSLFKSLPYDIVRDFAHVSSIGTYDIALYTSVNSPFNTVEDVINFANKNPGKLNIGTISIGSTQNLAAELFKSLSGVNASVVPFKSSSEVTTNVISGEIQLAFDNFTPILGNIKASNIKVIAIGSKGRFSALPNIPTLAESGVPNFEATSWNGISVPAKTPKAIIQRLNQSIQLAINSPSVKQKMLELGVNPQSSTPEEMTEYINADIVKWGQVIEKAKIEKQ